MMNADTIPDTPNGHDRRAVLEHLSEWEHETLISHAQAEAIRAFESGQARPRRRRVPLVAEALGYLGAALTVGATIALIGPNWNSMSHVARMVPFAVAAVASFSAGYLLRDATDPALARLASVLWTLTVGAVAATLAVALFDREVGDAGLEIFVLGVVTALVARILHVVRPSVPLVFALYAATLTTAIGAGRWAVDGGATWLEPFPTTVAVIVLVVSALWVVAGTTGTLVPATAAIALGTVGAAYAPIMLFGELEGLAFGLGIAVAIALLVGSVTMRNPAMLVVGVLALFGYLVGAIVRYLSDTAGLPIALLLSGVTLVVLAILAARLRRFTAPRDTRG
jgi:hypothetical protein